MQRWIVAHPRFTLNFTPHLLGLAQAGGWPSFSVAAWSAGCSARSSSSPRIRRTHTRNGGQVLPAGPVRSG